MNTEITLHINPAPNWDEAPTQDQLAAVRDEAVRRVREQFPNAAVDGEVEDNLRSFSYWDNEGKDLSITDEQRIMWAINDAWDHVFQS